VNYIHKNPVVSGFVQEEHHWRYSSALNYSGSNGLIDIDMLWEA
jgi:putative transposase